MNTYTNKFSFAINSNKDELILCFSQESPIFPNGVFDTETQVETTANLVMNTSLARELAVKLLDKLGSLSDDE